MIMAGEDGVSIHAPRERRDKHEVAKVTDAFRFQSTRPVRGATLPPQQISC